MTYEARKKAVVYSRARGWKRSISINGFGIFRKDNMLAVTLPVILVLAPTVYVLTFAGRRGKHPPAA